jgi:chorismate synthase
MLRFVTAGESHGAAVVTVLEGLPAGLTLDLAAVNAELRRRQGGYGRGGRMQIESDSVEVLSGLRGGVTIGSPLTMIVHNKDARLETLPPVTRPRPGHADLAGALKYGTTDARGSLERASARETVGRVLVGAACGQLLAAFGIEVVGFTRAVGGIECARQDWADGAAGLAALRARRNLSPFFTLDNSRDAEMRDAVDAARRDGDTLGGLIEVAVLGLPPGLGNHTQWDRKLDGQIAQACMSVQAMKSVEIGFGREAAAMRGSAVHDPIVHAAEASARHAIRGTSLARTRNGSGGLEAGLTNGSPLIVTVGMKPISTLMQPLASVDLASGKAAEAAIERSDVCAVPAASVVLQAAVCVPIAAAMLEKFGGDSLAEMRRNFDGYVGQLQNAQHHGGTE